MIHFEASVWHRHHLPQQGMCSESLHSTPKIVCFERQAQLWMEQQGSDEHSRTHLKEFLLPFRSQSYDPKCLFNWWYSMTLVEMQKLLLQVMGHQHTPKALVSSQNLIFQRVQGFDAGQICVAITTYGVFSGQANGDCSAEIPQTSQIVFFGYLPLPLMRNKVLSGYRMRAQQYERNVSTMAHDARLCKSTKLLAFLPEVGPKRAKHDLRMQKYMNGSQRSRQHIQSYHSESFKLRKAWHTANSKDIFSWTSASSKRSKGSKLLQTLRHVHDATSIKGAQRTFHSGFSLLIQMVGRQMVAYSFLWHLCSNLLEQSVFLRKLAFCGRVSAERAALQWTPVLRVCVCVFLSVGILWILMIIPYDNSYSFSYGI